MRMFILMTVAVVAGAPALAQVVSYEANSFPETQGWERVIECEPERAVADGILSQVVEFGLCFPTTGDRDAYTRSLGDFEAVPEFFVEFRMHSSADRSVIIAGRPTFVDMGGPGVADYHFTMVQDQVRYFRSTALPSVFVDIAPGVFHTYRLELYGTTTYKWFVDGILADEGVPEDYFPQDEPIINFGITACQLDAAAWWDYLRYGVIAVDASGDFDSDGAVDANDFYYFKECFTNSGPEVDAGPGCRWADFDADTDVDCDDWTAFKEAWTDEGSTPYLGICRDGIPTVSTWGMAIMTLLILVAGTIVLRRNEPG